MSEMQIQDVEIVEKQDTALYLITKAEIDNQISTAKAFPRSLGTFMQRAKSMATIDVSVAESCSYSLPRSGKSISGPSVRLAEIVCSTYGNIRAGARVIDNDGKRIMAQGICHDLESNTCITVEVSRRITDKNGRTFNEDMQTLTGNAACAIAFRNAVFKVVPSALIHPVYEAAREVARGDSATLSARLDKAISWFGSKGIKEVQILSVLGVAKREDIDLDGLQELSGMKSAVTNGETTLSAIFESEEDTKPLPPITDNMIRQWHKEGNSEEALRAEFDIKPGQEELVNSLYL